MDIITKNPYRYLGIFSNSSTKERIANKGKINAFLKVGKSVTFPLDLPKLLSTIDRTIETISNAESEITLPIDQIKFAQFWWMNATQLDSIAFNHLINGDIDTAKSIWDKKDNVSSLQNRFLLSTINEDWNSAIHYAELLYTSFSDQFITKIVGESISVSKSLWQILIDSFYKEGVNINYFINISINEEWKRYISEMTISPLIDSINKTIDLAKSSKGKDAKSRFQAGENLMTSTKKTLNQLKIYLPVSDIRYQTIADKLATEILQCGIDYYNNSDEYDRAMKAMKLQKYAYTIAVGSLVKERCKSNVDILQKIIAEIPPVSVMAQYKAIQYELRKYCKLPDKICYAITLLKSTKPHLDTMKSIIGSSNTAYIKLSTEVVGNALHNVIEEVNDVQRSDINERQDPIAALIKISSIKSTLRSAWTITLIMDTFDMDLEFKTNHYMRNKQILKDLCNQLDVPTPSHNNSNEVKVNQSRPILHSTNPFRTSTNINHSNPQFNSKSENNTGCFASILLPIIGGLCLIGGTINGIIGAIICVVIGLFIVAKF